MDILLILDKASSKAAWLLLLLVVLKFLTKRLHLKKADQIMLKVHRPISCCLIALGLVHGIASFRSFTELGVLPYVVGGISLLSIMGALYTFQLRKTDNKWLHYHRVLALIAIISCVLHPMI